MPSDPYDQLYALLPACTHCHSHPEIKALVEAGKFKYHWIPYDEGAPPFKFIFVAMEPTPEGVTSPEPEEGAFNEPLRFAINQFLFAQGETPRYLITNMAKCSMPVEATEARGRLQ